MPRRMEARSLSRVCSLFCVSIHAACMCAWRRRRRVVLYRPRARGESGDGSEVLGLFEERARGSRRGRR